MTTAMSGEMTATLELPAPTASSETTVPAVPEPESGLWYRLNSTSPRFLPVASRYHAESLLRHINDNEPWVTIVSGPPKGDSTYYQVLGAPDRLIAEGGIHRSGTDISWRATALPIDEREDHVGPDWYRLDVWRSDVLTIHDALKLIWPTFADPAGTFHSIAGLVPVCFQ